MTPWRIRKRLHQWLITKLIGLEFAALDVMEPEPAPPASEDQEDEVISLPDDAPFLGDGAAQLIAKPRSNIAPATEAKPLVGSVEERFARTRPRW